MTASFEGSERRFFDAKDRARFAMIRRFEAEPGTRFRYDNPAADLLTAPLAQAFGETPVAYAQRHLFAPLGIEVSDCSSGSTRRWHWSSRPLRRRCKPARHATSR